MTLPLYLVDSPDMAIGATLILPPQVARHALRSMRLSAGDALQLSDGKGVRAVACIVDEDRGAVHVESVEREAAPPVRLGLVQALAKGGRDEQAIETATEIGVDEVIPWQADRSIVQWKGERAAKGEAKWLSVLRAATEQSRRAAVPGLAHVMTSRRLALWISQRATAGDLVVVLHQDAIDTWRGVEERAARMGARADAAREESRTAASAAASAPTVWVIVGPEGGIADEEVAAFTAAGAKSCVIGRTILRASTAGPVALALLSRATGRYE